VSQTLTFTRRPEVLGASLAALAVYQYHRPEVVLHPSTSGIGKQRGNRFDVTAIHIE
jgi:hypothetical protein